MIKAFDTLFNRRDYDAASTFWSPGYIQHSAHIAPGREGLFDLIRAAPATLHYEHGIILAESEHVMVHGRFSGMNRPANWIAVDILRVADGLRVEHWDVLQDEATRLESLSGSPMLQHSRPDPSMSSRSTNMNDKPVRIPNPDHPITIERNPNRVVVTLGGKVIADTSNALTLREASYVPVQYIPREDVDMAALKRTEHGTYCSYKGDASYFSIPAGGERSTNAIWTYEAPYEAVASIKDHLAFYPDRVDEIRESAC